ncbi:hypothetical protein ACT7DN_30380 [Bacillus paranthracis]
MPKQKYWDGSKWVVIGTDADQVSLTDANNILNATNVEAAINEIATTTLVNLHEFPSDYDDNDVAKTVEWKRKDGKLYRKSILSNPDPNGNYLDQIITYYATNGSTVIGTQKWKYTYDAKGRKMSEVSV